MKKTKWKMTITFTTKEEPIGITDACKIRERIKKVMLDCKLGNKPLCLNSFEKLEEVI